MDNKFAIKCVLSMYMLSNSAYGNNFQYFEGGINYWGKDKTIEAKSDTTSEMPKKEETSAKEETDKENVPFDWKKHLDPKNEEFFREGDHVPPEPFMELVRNPSDKNIRMWFAYIEKKNTLAERLSRRMQEYTQANQATFSKEAKATIAQNIRQLPIPEDDFQRYRFRMYFDSNCPHCQRMFATLNDLQDRGYFVEARQVDRGPIQHIKSLVPIVTASSDEVKSFNVSSVPLLLVGDLKNKAVYRQAGFATPEDVLAELRTK